MRTATKKNKKDMSKSPSKSLDSNEKKIASSATMKSGQAPIGLKMAKESSNKSGG